MSLEFVWLIILLLYSVVFSFVCIYVLFLLTQARDLIFLYVFMLLYLGGTARRVIWSEIILYMRGLNNYCMLICIAVLTNFHSVPTFPKCESGAFNGDYRGLQGLSRRTWARNLPSVGFAILSAFHSSLSYSTCQRAAKKYRHASHEARYVVIYACSKSNE